MFISKKKNKSLDYKIDNYKMKDSYDSSSLIVGNLEYISNESTAPTIITTSEKYLFEVLIVNGEIKYREIFTGFVSDLKPSNFFNLPYVVNTTTLKKQLPTVSKNISKYALLLVLNEINIKENAKILKK